MISLFEAVGERLVGVTTLDADRGRVVGDPDRLAGPGPLDHARGRERRRHRRRRRHTGVAAGRLDAEGDVATRPLRPRRRRPHADRAARARLAGGRVGQQGRELAAFSFTVFTRPPTLFRWTDASEVAQWSALPGGPDGHRYRVEQATLSVDRRHRDRHVPRQGRRRRRRAHADADGSRPVILTGYGGFGVTMSPAWSPARRRALRRRRPVRSGVHPRRRRGGRGLAPGRHARAQAAGVRRLLRRRRLAGRRGPHHSGTPRHPRRIERRAAHGRRRHPTPRPVPGRPLCGAAARHGALPPVPDRQALDPRVRRSRRGRGVRLAPRLLAVPPGGRRQLLSGDADHHRRGGQPGRPHPRPQVRGPDPGGDVVRSTSTRSWSASRPGPATARASRCRSRPTSWPTCWPFSTGNSVWRRTESEAQDASPPPAGDGGTGRVGATGAMDPAAGMGRGRRQPQPFDRGPGPERADDRPEDELLVQVVGPAADIACDEVRVEVLQPGGGENVTGLDAVGEAGGVALDGLLDAAGDRLGLLFVPPAGDAVAAGVVDDLVREMRVRPRRLGAFGRARSDLPSSSGPSAETARPGPRRSQAPPTTGSGARASDGEMDRAGAADDGIGPGDLG